MAVVATVLPVVVATLSIKAARVSLDRYRRRHEQPYGRDCDEFHLPLPRCVAS